MENKQTDLSPFNHVACVYHVLKKPGDSPTDDGRELANQCLSRLRKIDNLEQFPPRLLILLTTPSYLDMTGAKQLLAAIHETFTQESPKIVAERAHECPEIVRTWNGACPVPLIGSSVAGIVADGEIHEQGVLLVCIASRILAAHVVSAMVVRKDSSSAVTNLIRELRIPDTTRPAKPENPDISPLGDRWLLTFMPGFGDGGKEAGYLAPDLHRRLWKAVMGRIPVVGGVSSAGDASRSKAGLQYVNNAVFKDHLAAALIESGAPYDASITNGMALTTDTLCVEELTNDGRTIQSFRGRKASPSDVYRELEQKHGFILLGEFSYGEVCALTVAWPQEDGSLELHRPVDRDAVFRVLKPGNNMSDIVAKALEESRKSFHLDKPLVDLVFTCRSRHVDGKKIGLDEKEALRKVSEKIGNAPCLGGLFDGEIGLNEFGASRFDNWSIAQVLIGDQIRQRSVLNRGFDALALHGPSLLTAKTINEVMSHSLEIIRDTGYPGAMISLVMYDTDQSTWTGGPPGVMGLCSDRKEWIVARQAIGRRFRKIVEQTRRPRAKPDLLWEVADMKLRDPEPGRYVPESDKDPRCNQKAVTESGIISQYVVPLREMRDGKEWTFAVVQIDLGDTRHHPDLHQKEKDVLKAICDHIAAALTRVMNREELRIARALDEALVPAMACDTLEGGIQRYIKATAEAFGVDWAHVRLLMAEKDDSLELVAGVGPYYEAAKKERPRIDICDSSPTTECFLKNRTMVVNDTTQSEWHKRMCLRFSGGTPVGTALLDDKAFANVPFSNARTGRTVGVVNMVATVPWYFTVSHAHSLEDLGRRFGTLITGLQTKLDEKDSRDRLSFLLKTRPQLARIAGVEDMQKVLYDAVERFRSAFKATTASLFIYDEDLEQLVLWAEKGWVDHRWIGGARYARGSGWTARAAFQEKPWYVPDLRKWKEEQFPGQQNVGRYADMMFGGGLSPETTVEAVALPLWIGARNLGVLTLHCRKSKSSEKSGFATTDLKLLIEARDNMAALVDALVSHNKDLWEKMERGRHARIMSAIINSAAGTPTEERLVSAFIGAYRAHSVAVSLAVRGKNGVLALDEGPRCVKTRDNSGALKTGLIGGLVQEAFRSGKVETDRVPARDANSPEDCARAGRVNRACIPLRAAGQTWGVLDARWKFGHINPPSLERQHSSPQLQALGDQVGAIVRMNHLWEDREKARKQAELISATLTAMGAMFSQSGHHLGNLLGDLESVPRLLLAAETPEEREELITDLAECIGHGKSKVTHAFEVAKRMANVTRASIPLASLIDESVSECAVPSGCSISNCVPNDLHIFADPVLLRESFSNVINNAFLAMPDGGTLTVRALPGNDAETVRIEFEDMGCGMTGEQLERALSGECFVKTGGKRMGIGIPIARTLVHVNQGFFHIESREGVGTKVLIDLPRLITEEQG